MIGKALWLLRAMYLCARLYIYPINTILKMFHKFLYENIALLGLVLLKHEILSFGLIIKYTISLRYTVTDFSLPVPNLV